MTFIIPMTSDGARRANVEVCGRRLVFRSYFHVGQENKWLLDIMDVDENPLISGIALEPGSDNVLKGQGDKLNGVQLFIYNDTDLFANPVLYREATSLGANLFLLVFCPGEFNPFIAPDVLLTMDYDWILGGYGVGTEPPDPGDVGPYLQVKTESIPAMKVFQPFSFQMEAINVPSGAGLNWSSYGLPNGLTISQDGIINGVPTQTGLFAVNIRVVTSGTAIIDAQAASKFFDVSVLATDEELLQITTDSLPEATVGEPFSYTLTATGGLSDRRWDSYGLPDGLTLDPSTGIISGTPSTASESYLYLRLYSGNQVATKTILFSVLTPEGNIPNPNPLKITSEFLPDGEQGQAYSYTLEAEGGWLNNGVFERQWQIFGLPLGLSLDRDTGEISGTPTWGGNFVVRVLCQSGTDVVEKFLPFLITGQAETFSIITQSLPQAVRGSLYSEVLTASGNQGAVNWTFINLPLGLTGNSATGQISGTPQVFGLALIYVIASDVLSGGTVNATARRYFTLEILSEQITEPITDFQIVQTSLIDAQETFFYSKTLTTINGVAPIAWSASGLPSGLSIDPSSGTISGVPTVTGDFSVIFNATDSTGQLTSRTIPLHVRLATDPHPEDPDEPEPIPDLEILTPFLFEGKVGLPFNQTLEGDGGEGVYTWSASGLPDGLVISSDGEITGTPTTAGTVLVTITLTDGTRTVSRQFSQLILEADLPSLDPVEILTTALYEAQVGEPFYQILQASGGDGAYTWAVENLPDGLTWNMSTGEISGTPTEAGLFTLEISVTSGTGSQISTAQTTLLLTVLDEYVEPEPDPQLILNSNLLPNGRVGDEYAYTLSASGGNGVYLWAVDTLPDGLELEPSTGEITGTPTDAGFFAIGVTVSSGIQTVSGIVALTIQGPPVIVTVTLPDATINVPYSGAVSASGGDGNFVFSAYGLPTGLSIDSVTGAITGTPAIGGTFNISITVVSANFTVNKLLTLTINVPPLQITTTSIPVGELGIAYSFTMQASGGDGIFAWSADGLPTGLTINSASGVISGTPSVAGTFTPYITVTSGS